MTPLALENFILEPLAKYYVGASPDCILNILRAWSEYCLTFLLMIIGGLLT